MRRKEWAWLSATILLAACAGGGASLAVKRAGEELELGRFENAYREIRKGLAEKEDDPALRRLERKLRLRALVARARDLCFERKYERAMDLLARALELSPDYGPALAWRAAVRRRLGEDLADRGNAALGLGKLEEALDLYQKALGYVPDLVRAKKGLQEVSQRFQEKREQAEECFRNAVRAREQGRFVEVLYHAERAVDLDPTRRDAKELVLLAESKLAEEEREEARRLAEGRAWGGAARRYRAAAKRAKRAGLPWAAEAEKEAALLEQEARARELMLECRQRIAAEDYDEAAKLLEKARRLSRLEMAKLGGLSHDLRIGRIETLARRARELRLEGRYARAEKLYLTIASLDPEGTWKERAAAVRVDAARARELYERALKALEKGDLESARNHLQECCAFAPGFKDASRKLRELRTRIGKRKEPGGPDPAADK